MFYVYILLAVVVFLYDWLFYGKIDKEYSENLIEYMRGDLEEYFEVKYIKKQYLIYVVMFIPVGLACIEKFHEAEINRWLCMVAAVLCFTVPGMYFIYKSLQKIVYDHGEIRYCLGSIVRVRAGVCDVDTENSCIYQVGEKADQRLSIIVLTSGEKIYFTTDSMDYGYKLEALMRKKDLGIDPELEMLEELYREDVRQPVLPCFIREKKLFSERSHGRWL